MAVAEIAEHKSKATRAGRAEKAALREISWKDEQIDTLKSKREQVPLPCATSNRPIPKRGGTRLLAKLLRRPELSTAYLMA